MDRTRLLATAFPRGPHKVFSLSVVCEVESIPSGTQDAAMLHCQSDGGVAFATPC
jgi:hypothetical protein